MSPTCLRRGTNDEITFHVLRDCNYTTQVWIKCVPSNCITNFFPLIAGTRFLPTSTSLGTESPALSGRQLSCLLITSLGTESPSLSGRQLSCLLVTSLGTESSTLSGRQLSCLLVGIYENCGTK